jgi:hypothetical protein
MRGSLFRRWRRWLGCAGGIVGTASHVVGFRLSDNHVDGKCVDYLYVSAASHRSQYWHTHKLIDARCQRELSRGVYEDGGKQMERVW